VQFMIITRRENAGDLAAIHHVETRAFGRSSEAELVDALRGRGAIALSLVAFDEKVVGHVMFSPVAILGEANTFLAVGLGPVVALPTFQRQGIGAELIWRG
jgi:putative acetyltransferase